MDWHPVNEPPPKGQRVLAFCPEYPRGSLLRYRVIEPGLHSRWEDQATHWCPINEPKIRK